MSQYTCVCGKCFTNSQAYNGHKSHCKIHQINKYGDLATLERAEEKRKRSQAEALKQIITDARQIKAEVSAAHLQQWQAEKHVCESCGKVMLEKFGSGRFCSKTCANRRKVTKETREKISERIAMLAGATTQVKRNNLICKYLAAPNFCIICGATLPFELRTRKTCSDSCLAVYQRKQGLHLSTIINNRSKNEITFCELCENYFGKENVLHNEPLFNGWDADIIIPKYKIAILWNGPWHYRKITAKHSLEQVQTRDKLKQVEIINCGYTCYVIKDIKGKADLTKVTAEFNNFLDSFNFKG